MAVTRTCHLSVKNLYTIRYSLFAGINKIVVFNEAGIAISHYPKISLRIIRIRETYFQFDFIGDCS